MFVLYKNSVPDELNSVLDVKKVNTDFKNNIL